VGKHILVDGVGSIPSDVAGTLAKAARTAGATVLHQKQIILPCEKSKPHSPPGGTAVVLLDESHISLHWYDRDDGSALIAIDAFTCGTADPNLAIDYLLDHLTVTVLHRETRTRFAIVEV
jgi:S-adenosylmethionine/arginine decarboxylase-like enzyme